MYLSSIELFGFKSFAQKTKLVFTDGLSAVVGPNGCGKSNIVDAVRWVLGEKKASVLRSEVMENVIFNGSRKRKPLGMAEVTLTIENNKKILPLEYDQVTITRRLFRSGESEYLMNKVKCRLRDIHDLFMDTGMGSDSYSVIELKMVEALLSGRVDDRRRIFEEAAGIKKYKQRRKETLSRLEAVNRDMERYVDIIEEVRKNVVSLERQASKTKRYNILRQELEGIELRLFANEYLKLNNEKEKNTESLNILNAEKAETEKKLSETITTLNSYKNELAEIEEKHGLALEQEKLLLQKIKDTETQYAISSERIDNYENETQRLKSELESAQVKIQSIINETELIQTHLINLEEKKNSEESILNELKAQSKIFSEQTSNLRTKGKYSNEEIFAIQNKISVLRDSIKRLEDRQKLLNENRLKLDGQTEEINRQLNILEEKKIELERITEEFESEAILAKTNLEKALEEKTILEQNINSFRERLDNEKSELSARKASLVFLEGLETGSESVKYLSKSKWNEGKDKTLFGEITDTNEKFRVAIYAALGDAGQSFVVEDYDNAFDGIELLKSNKKGKVGFIKFPKSNGKNLSNELKGTGIYGRVSSLVESSNEIKRVIELLLGETYIVGNRNDAINCLNLGAERAVTLDGEIFHHSGYIQGGSLASSEGIAIGRKERIKKLNSEIKNWENKVLELEQKIVKTKESIVFLDIPDFENKLRQADNNLANSKNQQTRLEIEFEATYRTQQQTDENKDRYENEYEEINQQLITCNNEIEELEPLLVTKRNEYESLNAELKESELNLDNLNENLKQCEIKFIQLQSDINLAKNHILRISNEKNELDNSIIQKNESIQKSIEVKVKLEQEIIVLRNSLNELQIEVNEVARKVALSAEEKKIISEQTESINFEIDTLQKESIKKNEQIHKIDLNVNEITINLNHIIARAEENYSVNVSELTPQEEEFDISEQKQHIDDLKNKLSKLGNINFQALEEYETQKERLDFSESQMQDLIDSKKILTETIAEINVQAEKNFSETFDAIRENFKMLFQKLFGSEGEADIILADDNLLEADIEVSAKPPGKRPHSIEMLSGGEKTLTAIALLFAIYLVKPSPFCILDEVDAPLDDKNIGLFLNMIKEFQNNTQFLLVTHNKRTMAESENLYGITMQEDGVSKVVSVNLEGIK